MSAVTMPADVAMLMAGEVDRAWLARAWRLTDCHAASC